jgi:mannose/fructose/N-acetylgalactosamine-specific phosphotransferase system component IID/mannose/fructose/N-acetylgalactosamine-specific phosphotransferase system component IIC
MFKKSAAVGGFAALALLALAFAVPGAVLAATGPVGAPAGAPVGTGTVTVAAGQAALIALGYYLSNSPWLFGLAYYTLFRPLVAGLLVGVILGHPAEGTLIGAAINVPYLGFISAGGNLPGDLGLAGWVGTTIALAGHLDPATAIAVAVPLGLLGTIIFFGRMAVSPVFAHWADARAEKADIRGVALMNWLPPQIFLFVISWVPVFLLALNGPGYVNDALNQLPTWFTNGLIIAGGILPAIGIALTMRFIFRGSAIPYFFIGFILYTFTAGSMSLVVIAAIGLALAYLHLSFTRTETQPSADTAEALAAAPAIGGAASGPGEGVRVTRGDLLKSWVLWTFFSHANYNYERLQGTGFAHAMTPIISRLYKTEDEIRAALKRHLVFFNTEPNFGNVIHGAVIAMEEQRANGAAIGDDAINSVKSGLMGPISGIGDSMSQSTITPILLALGIGIAGGSATGGSIPSISAGATGNPLGPIIYVVLISAIIVGIGYTAWMQGYLRGRSFVTDLLRSGTIDRVLVGAGVLGNLVLGALAASFVTIHLAPTVSIAGAQINIQASVLDPVFPGLLPLGAVLLTWWLLRRRVSPLALLAAFLVFSILAAYPFFGPGQKDANDFSYEACTSSLLHPFAPCGKPPLPTVAPSPVPAAPSAAPSAAPTTPAPTATP